MINFIEVTTVSGSKFVLSVFATSPEKAIEVCMELSSVVHAEVKEYEI